MGFFVGNAAERLTSGDFTTGVVPNLAMQVAATGTLLRTAEEQGVSTELINPCFQLMRRRLVADGPRTPVRTRRAPSPCCDAEEAPRTSPDARSAARPARGARRAGPLVPGAPGGVGLGAVPELRARGGAGGTAPPGGRRGGARGHEVSRPARRGAGPRNPPPPQQAPGGVPQ
ncbi:hypothetical protein ACFWYO_28370, partial [Streptomyces sp. NPDC059016]